MARRKLYGQFHQPSHILRYYPIEMECFVPVSGEVATTGSASWWFRAGRHHQCKDVLFDGRAGQVIGAGEQG
jgi:hypothetical protein